MPADQGPVSVCAGALAYPLHSSVLTRAAEAAVLATHAPFALMASAGQAVAKLALALAPTAERILVYVGPGNNGGDGLVAAQHLRAAGKDVRAVLLPEGAARPLDAAQALQQAVQAGVPMFTLGDDVGPAPVGLVIDALLGLGGSRAPRGAMAEAIAAIGRSRGLVLAVDLPSGIDSDTGAVLGDAAVRADATLNLMTIKPGCFTHAGRDHAGQVWLDTLGVDAGASSAWLSGPPSAAPRPHSSHKGSYGDLMVVGGATGMAGAAWLAGHAALAAGAGRVYVSLLDLAAPTFLPTRPELMTRAQLWRAPPTLLAASTVVCGCGGGSSVQTALPALLTHAARLVIDADALNAIAVDTALATLLRARTGRGRQTILTPHPLEAARLLNCSVAEIQQDRLAAAVALAERLGSVIVLKGSGTVVTARGALPRINPTGNAALATAGSGDVLAGWIGGHWAQAAARPVAVASPVNTDESDLAALIQLAADAAWTHGRAADRFRASGSAGPLLAVDLIAAMSHAQATTL